MNRKQIPVSVRKALAEGNVRKAFAILKEPYYITGTVVKGQQLGRTLGFPTANIKLREEYPLFLANGVYAVIVEVSDEKYNGMANIGIRPTLEQHLLTVEVNIFDFSSDIYEKEISVRFIERIRDEQKFAGLNELKHQILKDKLRVSEILEAWNNTDLHAKKTF